ncbi:MAG: histidine kinase [Gemmatimonadales bacterium]
MTARVTGRPTGPDPAATPWLIWLAVWVPLAGGLAFAIMQLSGGGAAAAVPGALVTSLCSFGLGAAVWAWSARLDYRAGAGRFALAHGAAAIALSLAWWMVANTAIAVLRGRSPGAAVAGWLGSDVVGWDLTIGVALYGVAGAGSYAWRFHRQLEAERIARLKAESDERAARLRALEARLNPHFLFNTLHSVSAMLRTDPAAAEDALEALGNLLRDSLHGGVTPLRPLAEEWRFTEEYLGLERLRLGDRLDVRARLDSDALQRPVPRLLLQPLVENAVRHGIGERPNGGTITITATVDEADALVLGVQDDGVGAEPADQALGVGLAAARARIDAWSPPASLEVETEPDRGYRVRVRLPAVAS